MNIVPMLNEMKTNVHDVKNVVKNHNETTKSYASVLTEIKETTNAIKTKKVSRPLLPKNINEKTPVRKNDFPTLDTRTPKRKRMNEPVETPKEKLFKNRKLQCGTNETNNNNNNLGSPVNLVRPKKISPYAHMTQSLYISRLKNDVTVEKITEYITNNVSGAKLEDFALNLLVKKDQALDALSFISFRLRCTPEYYNIFKNSSFWPRHVMIGEFIETPRKEATFADFIDTAKANTNENESMDMETNTTDQSKNDETTEAKTT